MPVQNLKPILERANIPSRLKTLRSNLAALEEVTPRTEKIAVQIQRIKERIEKTKKEHIVLVYSDEANCE